MSIPFFYTPPTDVIPGELTLDEPVSHHVIGVLRMQEGERLHLVNGKGYLLTAVISRAHKKHCQVRIEGQQYFPAPSRKVSIGISLIKNNARFEWFLEKATEIGVSVVIPLLCERTEKEKFRHDRMQQICISAMLQSRQSWLPELREPLPLRQVIADSADQQKFLAHCREEEKRNLQDLVNDTLESQLILIGPEGDFTEEEIAFAGDHHFIGVALGNNRLRTETAGVVAAVLLRMTT